MSETVIKRYSVAFKQQVVREYEDGASMRELSQKYGIGGRSTVRHWIDKYGRKGTRHKLIVIQSPSEQNQVKKLKGRINQLEKVVAQLTLDKLMLESTIRVAEEQWGIDLKKKGAHSS